MPACKAQIVISECTFTEADHKDRAKVGMHLHADDIAEWLRVLECQHLVLVHVSRRTNLGEARRRLNQLVGRDRAQRVEWLMDHKHNKERYERQEIEAGVRQPEPEQMGRPRGPQRRPPRA